MSGYSRLKAVAPSQASRVPACVLLVVGASLTNGCLPQVEKLPGLSSISGLQKDELTSESDRVMVSDNGGLRADYYSVAGDTGQNAFTKNQTHLLTRVDPNIDFVSGGNLTHGPGLPANNFAVRWTGYFQAPRSGSYVFCSCADDGIRVIVDGNRVIDGPSYQTQAARFWGSERLNLEQGKRVPLRIDYFNGGGGGRVRMFFAINPAGAKWEDTCRNMATTEQESCTTTNTAPLNPELILLTKNFLLPAGDEIDNATAACQAPTSRLPESEWPNASDASVQKALKLFQRLARTKTSVADPRVRQVADLIRNGNLKGAARVVTEDNGFLDLTVRKFAARISSRTESPDTDLNDMIATIVGITRDRIDARQLLVGNFLYRGKEILFWKDEGVFGADAVLRSNSHYAQLEGTGVPLKCSLEHLNRDDLYRLPKGFEQNLVTPSQVQLNRDPAGVLTSRAFAEAHLIAGTNRRAVEKTFQHFTCQSIDSIRTVENTDQFIGRDVERFPNGPDSHADFKGQCMTCHSTLDSLRPAFAYYHFENGVLKYGPDFIQNAINTSQNMEAAGTMRLTDARNFTNPTQNYGGGASNASNKLPVAWKINHNSIYGDGHFVTNDQWTNPFADTTLGSKFGWVDKKGQGLREYGKMFARSGAFPRCMARRVYAEVCNGDPFSKDFPAETTAYLERLGELFAENGYDLRDLFETVATTCVN